MYPPRSGRTAPMRNRVWLQRSKGRWPGIHTGVFPVRSRCGRRCRARRSRFRTGRRPAFSPSRCHRRPPWPSLRFRLLARPAGSLCLRRCCSRLHLRPFWFSSSLRRGRPRRNPRRPAHRYLHLPRRQLRRPLPRHLRRPPKSMRVHPERKRATATAARRVTKPAGDFSVGQEHLCRCGFQVEICLVADAPHVGGWRSQLDARCHRDEQCAGGG